MGILLVAVVLDLVVALHCGNVGQLGRNVDDIYRGHLIAGNHAVLLGLGHDGHIVVSGDGVFVGVPGLATVGAVHDGGSTLSGDFHLLGSGVGSGNGAEGGSSQGFLLEIDHGFGVAHEEGLVGLGIPLVAKGQRAFVSNQPANNGLCYLIIFIRCAALVDLLFAQSPHVLVVHGTRSSEFQVLVIGKRFGGDKACGHVEQHLNRR